MSRLCGDGRPSFGFARHLLQLAAMESVALTTKMQEEAFGDRHQNLSRFSAAEYFFRRSSMTILVVVEVAPAVEVEVALAVEVEVALAVAVEVAALGAVDSSCALPADTKRAVAAPVDDCTAVVVAPGPCRRMRRRCPAGMCCRCQSRGSRDTSAAR